MSVKETLELFGKRVEQQSKSNLTRRDKRATDKLYESVSFDLEVHKNSFRMAFKLEDYWEFVDKGVKGALSDAKAPNSPFSYKDKMPPTKVFDRWIIKRGFAPRKNGKFQSRESLKFAIATNVFKFGIKTTNFFSRPFENEFKKLPTEVVEAYGLELESFLQFTFKK